MKNDISFVIGGNISIYEHQSTENDNMPLRNSIYISNLYAGITSHQNLYGSKVISLPNPQFMVFYNGRKELPDVSVQKLSDAYEVKVDEVNLELTVILLNINKGHNKEFALEKAESRNEGIIEGKILLIKKKILKSKSLETIADELECEIEEIRGLYEVIQECKKLRGHLEVSRREINIRSGMIL
ncbi:MAG: hypothetical protein R3Y67_08480 [Eubacteriales bacterium]